MKTSATQFWELVAEDLGIHIETPYAIRLSDGSSLVVDALVKDFGPPLGMLVAADYAVLKPFKGSLVAEGYGYATNIGEGPYERASMVEVLKDWEWSGPQERKPDWLD